MNKINFYLFNLTSKYIFINLVIVSVFIMFLNLIEISRILEPNDNNIINYLYLSFLKYPTILNEILPFVTIIGVSFLLRNLINNNELISMRNIGLSIFDIFLPIGICVFIIGLFFLIILNPISASFENKFEQRIKKNEQSLYSIKILNNEMWIKNKLSDNFSSFINIQNIDLKDMKAKNIKILLLDKNKNIFIQSQNGYFEKNKFFLNDVKFYNLNNDLYNKIDNYDLEINFNKKNIVNAIANYRLVPFYKYITHTNTLNKFNLYSSEIGLYYLSEILKPLFIVMLSFVVLGYSGKFKRNENFFKILFISILIGFIIFFLKEIITKFTIILNINFFVSYLIIFTVPLIFALYQAIKIEND